MILNVKYIFKKNNDGSRDYMGPAPGCCLGCDYMQLCGDCIKVYE